MRATGWPGWRRRAPAPRSPPGSGPDWRRPGYRQGVDPDDLPGHVDQRTAGVARVDRRVVLDEVGQVQAGIGRVLANERPIALTIPPVTVLVNEPER